MNVFTRLKQQRQDDSYTISELQHDVIQLRMENLDNHMKNLKMKMENDESNSRRRRRKHKTSRRNRSSSYSS